MELHDLRNKEPVKVKLLNFPVRVPPSHRVFARNEIVTFYHIDGMFSYCKDKDGQPVHPAAWTRIEEVDSESSNS